jgi:predicted nucleic acid-binding protein
MIYLVDANVLSEPTKQAADSKVVAWLNSNESNLVVDSIVVGELRIGVLSLPPVFGSSNGTKLWLIRSNAFRGTQR